MKKKCQGILTALAFICIILGFPAMGRAEILRCTLDDEINPASAEYITSAITIAEQRGASLLVIELSTPGGFDTSMREIISRIVNSRVPIVVYVSPSGSRAASAGFLIMLASDIAAMAPGTNTGAAHPVTMGGKDFEKTMEEKVVNDASAYVRSLAEKRGRDPQVAESTIRESKSFTEHEALDKHLIDVVARDINDLLSQLNGRTVIRFDGSREQLSTEGEAVNEYKPSIRQRLLMALADPRIAFILFAIGALCVYIEFQHPGAIVPGVAGALAVVLALYGFHMLPINVTGVLLILVAIILFVIEVKVQSFGIIGIGGIAAAVIGSLILIDVPDPALRLPLSLVLAVVVPFAIILMFLLRLAFRARQAKVVTGTAGMIGIRGKAQTAISPEGTVFVRGELWKARSSMKIAPGEFVKVIGIDGLMLEVEVEKSNESEPRQTSALNEHEIKNSRNT